MELKGKTISFLGDSITEGAGLKDLSKRYDNIIAQSTGAVVRNYGIGGTRIAHKTVPSEKARYDLSFCSRAWDLDDRADVIVVFGGVNDYLHGDAPLGKKEDNSRSTFWGAVKYLCSLIREKYPKTVFVFMTPARTRGDEGPSDCLYPMIGEDGRLPLKPFVEAIEEIAPEYGAYVINLYEDLGIDPNRREDEEEYTVDGLHFNEKGHEAIASVLLSLLEAI